jgi:hypothetical protein
LGTAAEQHAGGHHQHAAYDDTIDQQVHTPFAGK